MLCNKVLLSTLFLVASSLSANSIIDNNLKKIEHSLSFKFVDVSKTDVNRIICENGEFGKVVYSKDKEISIQKDGENAFIKLLPVITRSNNVVIDSVINEFNRDVYFECNQKIYSLNLIPKDISAQTILLFDDGTRKNNIEAKRFEQSSPFEKTVINIIKNVYKEKEPDGYVTKILPPKYIKFNELELLPTKTYTGNDYMIYEYKITALENIELDEKMFINFVANNPLAISLSELNLQKNEEARLFVVSNATPDPITLEEKKQNFFSSLEDLNNKDDKEALKNNNNPKIEELFISEEILK